jgi:oligosaccharide repeat unit polymerase
VTLIHAFLTAVISVYCATSLSWVFEVDNDIRYLIYLTIVAFIWILSSWRLCGRSIGDGYGLFLCSMMVFHGGHIILEATGITTNELFTDLYFPDFSPDTIHATLIFILLSLLFLHLGGLIAHVSKLGDNNVQENSIPETDSGESGFNKPLFFTGVFFFCIALVPTLIYSYELLTAASEGGYLGIYSREIGTGLSAIPRILDGFFVPACLMMLVGRKNSNWIWWILPVACILLRSSVYMSVGMRNQAIPQILGLVLIFHNVIRPVPRSVFIGLGVAVMVLIPAIAAMRNVSNQQREVEKTAENVSFLFKPIYLVLRETGLTARIVAYTIEYVPGQRDYELGSTYFSSLTKALPNVGNDEAADSRGSGAFWLAQMITPSAAKKGWSAGYSAIAEFYLNFGWFGLAFAMVLGYIVSFFVHWTERGDRSVRLIILAVFLPSLLMFARGESVNLARNLMWYCVIPIALYYAVDKFAFSGKTKSSSAPYNTISA